MIKPTKNTLEFLDREFGVFFHFGIRTFNENSRDWDREPMALSTFNPAELDCNQWISEIKKCGAKYAVMTTKHHDGFALWPSKYTDYSVKNTPWKNGEGDVVKEFTDACRKNGIKTGLYYSCAQFSTKDMTSEMYNDFVCGQLEELYGGNYGDIDEIWFDGCGSDGFDFQEDRIEALLRKLQPNALIFGSWGNDIAWVGNERGYAHLDNSNNNEHNGKPKFVPVECDCTMVRKNGENFWFYNETYHHLMRTPDELVGMYYNTAGRGANLLLNIAPDRRGLLTEEELGVLREAYKELKFRFTECKIPTSEVKSKKYDDGKMSFYCEFDSVSLIDQAIIKENLENGEHIKSFTLYAHPVVFGEEKLAVYRGFTVGHKHICVFPTIRCRALEIVLDDADGDAQITELCPLYVGDRSGRQIEEP